MPRQRSLSVASSPHSAKPVSLKHRPASTLSSIPDKLRPDLRARLKNAKDKRKVIVEREPTRRDADLPLVREPSEAELSWPRDVDASFEADGNQELFYEDPAKHLGNLYEDLVAADTREAAASAVNEDLLDMAADWIDPDFYDSHIASQQLHKVTVNPPLADPVLTPARLSTQKTLLEAKALTDIESELPWSLAALDWRKRAVSQSPSAAAKRPALNPRRCKTANITVHEPELAAFQSVQNDLIDLESATATAEYERRLRILGPSPDEPLILFYMRPRVNYGYGIGGTTGDGKDVMSFSHPKGFERVQQHRFRLANF